MPVKNSKLKTQNSKTDKKVTKKPAVKVSKTATQKTVAKVSKPVAKTGSNTAKMQAVNLSVSVFGLDGKSVGRITLSSEIFGQEVNKKLLAQAVRVYQANKRQGNANTKTRGEVDGSTRKIYRQKGTGKARHGSVRAPIFVKGGIVHGPKPRDFSLDFPKKMRRKALFSALSAKLLDNEVKVLSGLEKITPKTKEFVSVLKKLELDNAKSKILMVTPDSFENAKRASRNLQTVNSTSSARLNALDVLRTRMLLLSKESISEMEKMFLKKE